MKSSLVIFFFCVMFSAFHARSQPVSSHDLILGCERVSDIELRNISARILQIPGTQIVGISMRLQLILVKVEDTMAVSRANIINQLRTRGYPVYEKDGSIAKVLNDFPEDFTAENNLPLKER